MSGGVLRRRNEIRRLDERGGVGDAQARDAALVRAAAEALAPELPREAVAAALRSLPPGAGVTAGTLVEIARAFRALEARAHAEPATE